MHVEEITNLIKAQIPDAQVHIEDTVGDRDHYTAQIISEAFVGKTRIQQHQIVYQALGTKMGSQLHALSLRTSTPVNK